MYGWLCAIFKFFGVLSIVIVVFNLIRIVLELVERLMAANSSFGMSASDALRMWFQSPGNWLILRALFFGLLAAVCLRKHRAIAWYICKPESACPSCGYPSPKPTAGSTSTGTDAPRTNASRCPECGESLPASGN